MHMWIWLLFVEFDDDDDEKFWFVETQVKRVIIYAMFKMMNPNIS